MNTENMLPQPKPLPLNYAMTQKVERAVRSAYEILPHRGFRDWAFAWIVDFDRTEESVRAARCKFIAEWNNELGAFDSDQLFAASKAMIAAGALAWFRSKPAPNLSSTKIITESSEEALDFAIKAGRQENPMWEGFWNSVVNETKGESNGV